MLYKCQRMGYSIGETPITFENRHRGDSKISQAEIFKAMYTVLRLAAARTVFRRGACLHNPPRSAHEADKAPERGL